MEISILKEAGHHLAIQGMQFSHRTECSLTDVVTDNYAINFKTVKRLASMDNGHNKFLESIMVWFDIRAPLKFWKQFDTYRVGITKQSKSTMHSILKRELTKDDFCYDIPDTYLDALNILIQEKDFDSITDYLPEGYLQTRRVCCSYKVIRTIIKQRQKHKLKEWQEFCSYMKNNLVYPELLGGDIVQN